MPMIRPVATPKLAHPRPHPTLPPQLPSYDEWLRRDRAKDYPRRTPDPKRLAAFVSLLEYGDWIQTATVRR